MAGIGGEVARALEVFCEVICYEGEDECGDRGEFHCWVCMGIGKE